MEAESETVSVDTKPNDEEAADAKTDDGPKLPQRITFGPEEGSRRRGRTAHAGSSRQSRRSASSDSISSVRSRAQSTSGIPIEFRTLSFQVADSQARRGAQSDEKDGKFSSKGKDEHRARDYFESLDWHKIPDYLACSRFNVRAEKGLSADEAKAALAASGKNTLPHRRESLLRKLLQYVFGGFCSVLWIGVIIFFICWRPLGDPDPAPYNLGLAILVLIVIFLQASFSAFQDWSTARTMNAILDLLPAEALVMRDGDAIRVSSAELVVGDIVKIAIGNKVPADLRLIRTSGDVRFDRSMLTGESDEVEGAIDMTDQNFLESRNMALMGTMVTNGSAEGVVVLTGGNSVMGRIAKATTGQKSKPTLIQREINRFVLIIVCLTALLASLILFTWAGWLRVKHAAFMNVIAMLDDVMGCVVAFIPEGMPVGVALTLLMIARRMKVKNILPKGLSTVETLGCVNIICSDKTGTLTENKMIVTTVGFVDAHVPADQVALDENRKNWQALTELHRAASLCNEANFDILTKHLPVRDRNVQGNATDGAVLKFAEELRAGAPDDLAKASPRVFQIAFNSSSKWMLTVHAGQEPEKSERQEFLLLIKGAPDVLLPGCKRYWSYQDDCVKEFDDYAKMQLSELQEKLSRDAERVILLCERRLCPRHEPGSNAFVDDVRAHATSDLTVIGVLGITDPPRKEAASTVASCRRAGARFFMITGDFGLTAAAIARKLGIYSGEQEPHSLSSLIRRRASRALKSEDGDAMEETHRRLLLEGPSISELLDEDWDLVCQYEEIVFARTTPEQKLRIVNELKARQNAVAVTGDGINDAPALRAADVGIAVVTGSDVALEAADLILLDKFDSIVDAIRLGRLVFQNLQKVIGYLLPAGSWSEIWPVLMNVFFGVPLPLSSFLMIIICVFTDLFLSLSLIMEKPEFDLLSLPPRNHRKDHLINTKIYIQSYLFIGVMETLCAHSMFFFYMYRHAGIPFHALIFAFEKYSAGFYGYTQAELTHFNTVGQSVYFVTLVILQLGNLLSVRNKRLSILQADPIRRQRRNPWLLASAVASIAIAIFVTEEPGIQSIFGTASIPIEFWCLPVPLALGILCMDEIRKVVVRQWPNGPIARIAW